MDLFTKMLLDSKENDKFLCLYEYSDDDKFWFGKVIDFNEEIIIFQHYTKFGKKEGKIVLRRSMISEIDFDNKYSKTMAYVISHRYEIDRKTEIPINCEDTENWRKSFLEQVKNRTDFLTSVKVNGSFYSGFVKETDEDFFMLHCIGTDGEDKGNIIFRIEDVTEFSFDDREDRKTLMLYQWKSKKTINKTLKAIDFGRGIF